MEILEQVTSTLKKLHFASPEIHLEKTSSGKVGGHVVSVSFTGKSQIERQHDLWKGLRSNLVPDELNKIVAILTVTPEEIGDDE